MFKKTIKILVGITLIIGSFYINYGKPTMTTYADDISEQNVAKYAVPAMVTYYATKYRVGQDLAHYIAKHESEYDPNNKGDLTITCHNKQSKFYGQPVYARGVYQLTRCYYPQVTDEQAFDPQYNIQFAMQIIAKGRDTCINQFSTCRDYYED